MFKLIRWTTDHFFFLNCYTLKKFICAKEVFSSNFCHQLNIEKYSTHTIIRDAVNKKYQNVYNLQVKKHFYIYNLSTVFQFIHRLPFFCWLIQDLPVRPSLYTVGFHSRCSIAHKPHIQQLHRNGAPDDYSCSCCLITYFDLIA